MLSSDTSGSSSRLSQAAFSDSDEDSGDNKHVEDANSTSRGGKKRGKMGTGKASKIEHTRTGYWMTERYGPHASQYKRIYVDGSGRRHSGKAAFAVS